MKSIVVLVVFGIALATASPVNSNYPANEEPIERAYNAWTDVKILLFTSKNPTVGEEIQLNNFEQLTASNFNPSHPTKFTIHGWTDDADSNVNVFIREAYLSVGEYNCFTVDWSIGAGSIIYSVSVDRVPDTGAYVGEFIDFLNAYGQSFSDITVIGHSLGAHIAGFAGKSVLLGKVQNIVALDPALPFFSQAGSTERVDRTDAVYVEVVHTDAQRKGIFDPIGHASFYANWGWDQPGCGLDLLGSCAHARAVELFAESITSEIGFWAYQCSSFEDIQNKVCQSVGTPKRMGGQTLNVDAEGVYYLPTNPLSPFAQGYVVV